MPNRVRAKSTGRMGPDRFERQVRAEDALELRRQRGVQEVLQVEVTLRRVFVELDGGEKRRMRVDLQEELFVCGVCSGSGWWLRGVDRGHAWYETFQ